MKLTHATLSRPGGRKVNEDAAKSLLMTDSQGCWVVADGLGGHGGGDVASKIVVDSIITAYADKPEFSAARLNTMLVAANQAIVQGQQAADRISSMRSTAVVLMLQDAQAWWAHVGDSRLYHFVHGLKVHQTRDHSVPQVMVDAGDIAYDDIRHHQDRNRLTRSLGNSGKLRATIPDQPVKIGKGDAFLLCTDGFWEYVTEAEMATALANAASASDWLTRMEAMLSRKAPPNNDNYTATAVFVEQA